MIACFFDLNSNDLKRNFEMMVSLNLNSTVFNSSTHRVCISVVLKRNSFSPFCTNRRRYRRHHCHHLHLPSALISWHGVSLLLLLLLLSNGVVLLFVYPHKSYRKKCHKTSSKSDNLWCHHLSRRRHMNRLHLNFFFSLKQSALPELDIFTYIVYGIVNMLASQWIKK